MVVAAFVAVVFLIAAPTMSHAKAKLWLYPDADSPRSGGHVVAADGLTLNVANRGSGNGDNMAYAVEIVVAVNDPLLVASVVVEVEGGYVGPVALDETGFPTYPCSGRTISPHGVYPAQHGSFSVGNIAAGATAAINVVITGEPGLEVHFDAIGEGKKEKKGEIQCYDVVNPFGHDVTAVIPVEEEPTTCPNVSIETSTESTGVEVGDSVDYEIVVTNSDECEALTNLVVTENIPTVGDPPEVAFNATTATPPPTSTYMDDPITWELEDPLAGGASYPISLTVEILLAADGHRVENVACVNADQLDEPVCDSAIVAVGAVPITGDIASPGFWCNRYRQAFEDPPRGRYTQEYLMELLAAIDDLPENGGSSVFPIDDEETTPEDAQDILCRPRGSDAELKLHRHLLALWLNVASERISVEQRLDELCPGDEPMPEDIPDGVETVGDVIAGAEGALQEDPPVAPEILLLWKDIIDFINNAYISTDGSCDGAQQMRRRSATRRAGRSAIGGHRP
jgi:hypothetical protein